MPEIRLFIAATLDGFIARENGSLDWLDEIGAQLQAPEQKEESAPDGGYGAFVAEIDVVVMGRTTYEEILGFGVDWPYAKCTSYVVTSDENYKTKTPDTFVFNTVDSAAIAQLKSVSKRNVWLVGGGRLISAFMTHDAIDEMTVSIASIVLGSGIRLFPESPKENKFDLIKTEQYGPKMVNLTYRKVVADA
jgi:dihydrofolate reductase